MISMNVVLSLAMIVGVFSFHYLGIRQPMPLLSQSHLIGLDTAGSIPGYAHGFHKYHSGYPYSTLPAPFTRPNLWN